MTTHHAAPARGTSSPRPSVVIGAVQREGRLVPLTVNLRHRSRLDAARTRITLQRFVAREPPLEDEIELLIKAADLVGKEQILDGLNGGEEEREAERTPR